jgi:hypothetical protein
MPFVVKAAKDGSLTASWLAPQMQIGFYTLGTRAGAAIFPTDAEAHTAADKAAQSLRRLNLVFSVEPVDCFVVKLVYDDAAIAPRWVKAGSGRGLGLREQATVFPDHEAAQSEADLWQAITPKTFSVLVEPA